MPRISDNYDEESNRDFAVHILWARRLKATAPRRAIIDTLRGEDNPISALDLEKKLKSVSVASIYRTLDFLEKAGMVTKIITGDERVFYEMSFDRKHHHHLICTGCGDMEDVKDCLEEKTEQRVLARSEKFASLSRHSLEFFGLCKKCEKNSRLI